MARMPRNCPAGTPQHIIHRGSNREFIFNASADFEYYTAKLHHYSVTYGVVIHAWVVMGNHVHLLVTPSNDVGISHLMKYTAGSYAGYFNRTYHHTGAVWERRFKNIPITEIGHIEKIKAYIELNPVRAGICTEPSEYRWSSCVKGVGWN